MLILFTCISVFAQKVVKGYVLDQNKDPLIGAAVQVKGTEIGTITNLTGNFQLSVPGDASTLVISYIGYITQEVAISPGSIEVIMAEDATALDAVEVTGFGGVVGQARRRVASVQKIPESVYALSGKDIENAGVFNFQSFAPLIPNVSFQTSQNVGVNFINVRGISQIRNGESPVAFVVDGVFIPDANLVNQELFDLALVEVVKGPQGTLYGKNAIGGAVNISTLAPTNYSKNRVLVGYGNGNSLKTQLFSSGPLVKDKLYYRISGSYKDSDGVIENETLNDEVDFLQDLTFRGQLIYNVTDRLTASVSYQRIDMEGGATYYSHARQGMQLDANDFDNNVINADQRGTSTLANDFGYLKLEYFFDNMTLKSVSSLNNAKRNHRGDLDFLPADILRQFQDSNSETFNQEIRLSSFNPTSAFVWDLGFFYQNADKLLSTQAFADLGFFALPPAPTGTQSLFANLSDFTNTFQTIAFFGFADYKVTDKLTLSAGLRYDNDQINQDNRLTNTKPDITENQLQPKASVAYQASDNVLAFVNYGRGYRSGGFNSEATELFGAAYEAETSDNYELGLKTTSFSNRLIVNVSGFLINFNNQQQYAVTVGTGGLILGNYNFPKTTVTGFEADLQFRTSKYADLFAGFGYTRSEIDEAENSDRDGTIDRSGFVGNITPFVPETTFNIGVRSGFALNDKVDFSGFVNLSNKGEIKWHEDNNDVSDPFNLLDARIGITFSKRYSVFLWGNNITDTEYFQEYFAGEVSGSAAGDIGWIGKPRTFGIELSVEF